MSEGNNMNNNDMSFAYLADAARQAGQIDPNLYGEYDVKRGLRDSTGTGVLTGLTQIADVCGFRFENGRKIPANGRLYFRGYDVVSLLSESREQRFAFEEAVYLLLFGELPDETEREDFVRLLGSFSNLPGHFVRDIIMKGTSGNLMNSLQKCILALYSYDENPDDISGENVLRQELHLIAKLPLIALYSYHAWRHFKQSQNLMLRNPEPGLSIAENILQILRPNGTFDPLEARLLDCALVLHAEHGGGNNSTFTNHVVTSSGTDTYSAMAASLASLKGPRHGGANLKVGQMIEDIKAHISDWGNENEIEDYLNRILNKEAFDGAGLIYGLGHAVYTFSDPRAEILKKYASKLAVKKGMEEEYHLLERIEEIGKTLLTERHKIFKPVCANVDFYSGFVYTMLDIPKELYTPLFAIARMAGWSAHRLEELVGKGKIIRPAYKYVGDHRLLPKDGSAF